VATDSRIFVGPGVESPGRPEYPPSSSASRSGSGSPRVADPPALLRYDPRVAPKCRVPQLASWWLFGYPRVAHLPAMPAVNLRVAPNLRSSGCACCAASSRPESRTLQRSRRSGSGSPLALDLLAHPLRNSPGCPVSLLPRLFDRWSSGLPRASHPPGLPHSVLAFPRILLLRLVR